MHVLVVMVCMFGFTQRHYMIHVDCLWKSYRKKRLVMIC